MRYGDFQEARTREITLDITPEAFQAMSQTACHMEPKLSPETAVHTLQAAKMYMIKELEEYCLSYLLAQTDCAAILQALTAAAKLSYQLEPEVLQKYWATILLKSSEVVASSAFLETHGSIIAQILKLDEFEVDEDTLWTSLRSGLPLQDEVTPYTLTESRPVDFSQPLDIFAVPGEVKCPWTPSPRSMELIISLGHARCFRRLELLFSDAHRIWSVGLKNPDAMPNIFGGDGAFKFGDPLPNSEISFTSTTVDRQVICTLNETAPVSKLCLTCKCLISNPAALTKITAP